MRATLSGWMHNIGRRCNVCAVGRQYSMHRQAGEQAARFWWMSRPDSIPSILISPGSVDRHRLSSWKQCSGCWCCCCCCVRRLVKIDSAWKEMRWVIATGDQSRLCVSVCVRVAERWNVLTTRPRQQQQQQQQLLPLYWIVRGRPKRVGLSIDDTSARRSAWLSTDTVKHCVLHTARFFYVTQPRINYLAV